MPYFFHHHSFTVLIPAVIDVEFLSLFTMHTPVKVTVFTSSGPLPGCKIALRCSACSVIRYNYSKYGNKQKEGERFYDERRDLIKVSDVVYCERQLSDLFTFLK